MNKTTRGMRAGRKLNKLLIYRWCNDMRLDRPYRINEWRKPFGVCKAAGLQRGNESKKPKTGMAAKPGIGILAKQPDCAISKFARVELMKNGSIIHGFIHNDSCLHFTAGDYVAFKVVKVSRVLG